MNKSRNVTRKEIRTAKRCLMCLMLLALFVSGTNAVTVRAHNVVYTLDEGDISVAFTKFRGGTNRDLTISSAVSTTPPGYRSRQSSLIDGRERGWSCH